MLTSELELDARFDGDALDTNLWFPYYLPHWSSRAQSTAVYSVQDDGLRLSIPVDQPLWCPDLHEVPLRVSAIQSGNFAGPLGSTTGQVPFQAGQVVLEEQPAMAGYVPHYGQVEVRMRGVITDRSMFAFFMSGIEDSPERSGEILVAEIFGEDVRDGTAGVGMGVKAFKDPALKEDWLPEPLKIDVSEFHTYGVDWRPGSLAFSVDGEVVRRHSQAPDYPVTLMIGVFDFPAKGAPDEVDVHVPEMVISHVRGRPLG